MSRTYKTRPRWVRLNDPTSDTIERHEHFAVRREKSGRMVTKERYNWKTGNVEPMQVPHEYVWVEAVPCTIDIPELPWRVERHKYNDDNRKRCDKRFVNELPCPCCSHRYSKELSHGAQRAKIKQEIKKALNTYGRNTDTNPMSCDEWPNGFDEDGTIYKIVDAPNWWDVDITTANVAEDWDLWD